MSWSHVAAEGGASSGAGASVASIIVMCGGLTGEAAGLGGNLCQTYLVGVAVINISAAHLRENRSCRDRGVERAELILQINLKKEEQEREQRK